MGKDANKLKELLEETQIADDSRDRTAVADATGRWHASDELIDAVIVVGSGDAPSAVSCAGWFGSNIRANPQSMENFKFII